MIGPIISEGAVSVPRSVQENGGKIGVGKMTVNSEKKTSTSEAAKTAEQVQVNDAENQAKAKKRAEDAGKLLKEYHVEPRVVLRLLTDGGAVAGALEGQAQAEIEVLRNRKDLSPEQKQKLASAIQERYKKLIQYSENREESTRKQIKKLEASQKPEDKVLLLDIKSARAQIEQSAYQENVNKIDIILKTQKLSPEDKAKYEEYQKALNAKIAETEKSVKDLKDRRNEIKNTEGNTVPDIIKEMAIAITGGEVKGVEEAQKDPIKYIQDKMVDALTTNGGVAKLADNLVSTTLLDVKDRDLFIKDMELGLKSEDIKEMAKSIAGKTALSFAGLLTMLGYAAFQRRKQENAG